MRSETSLIQTIGRAARNLDGKVILYADKETKSIKKAIKETERRRNIQLEYNKKNKISASTVKKEISDVLESVYEKDYVTIGTGANVGGNLKKHIKALNKKMKESATNLEFEEAAASSNSRFVADSFIFLLSALICFFKLPPTFAPVPIVT